MSFRLSPTRFPGDEEQKKTHHNGKEEQITKRVENDHRQYSSFLRVPPKKSWQNILSSSHHLFNAHQEWNLTMPKFALQDIQYTLYAQCTVVNRRCMNRLNSPPRWFVPPSFHEIFRSQEYKRYDNNISIHTSWYCSYDIIEDLQRIRPLKVMVKLSTDLYTITENNYTIKINPLYNRFIIEQKVYGRQYPLGNT